MRVSSFASSRAARASPRAVQREAFLLECPMCTPQPVPQRGFDLFAIECLDLRFKVGNLQLEIIDYRPSPSPR